MKRIDKIPETASPDELLIAVVNDDDLGKVELALRRGANPNACNPMGAPLVFTAAGLKSAAVLDALIAHGADVNYGAPRFSALHHSIMRMRSATTNSLLAAGCDPDGTKFEGCTPLHNAIAFSFAIGVELLLQAGANPASQDLDGQIPLHYAAGFGDYNAAKLLLERETDPGAVDALGRTPMHLAARNGKVKVLDLLIRFGAPIDARDHTRCTPLHYAAASNNESAVSVLLVAGSNPLLRDGHGNTALHHAAPVNNGPIAMALLSAGIDPQAQNHAGREALELTIGPVHGRGVQTALALLPQTAAAPNLKLHALLANLVRRASDIDDCDVLLRELLQRKVSLSGLTARDFRLLIARNRRRNKRTGESGYPPQALRALRLLEAQDCLIPPELLSEIL
jgi:ankyrin repeat protein